MNDKELDAIWNVLEGLATALDVLHESQLRGSRNSPRMTMREAVQEDRKEAAETYR